MDTDKQDAEAKREFEVDKVYLQDANGTIWTYEALLAGNPGFKEVVPNPSKVAKKEEKA